eukprot:CAMPEP_0171468534 /NCGR_PEP_ID=MMETSP0945-20130129/10658_1 /TAXON_ID=109269 /ORGANISM="Vaucheria litorea, Strain CCMP2940" /LENGTH=36 /DNA_ID= /DNA_START= /DNA_END= /DNA_ORIENTATION=
MTADRPKLLAKNHVKKLGLKFPDLADVVVTFMASCP